MAEDRQQYKRLGKEIEVIAINKPIRRIRKCPEVDPKLGELEISKPQFSFGPFFAESGSSASAKDEAWKKILETERKDEEKINEIYSSAIRRVEREARAAYADGALNQNDLTESKFRWMMIKDGCFFLQLTLSILGASKKLDYPDDHFIFGKKQSKKTFQGLIRSMFLLGNQIPLVVLNELMKQDFFRMVIDDVQLVRPSDMLSKQILYKFLVSPALQHSNNHQTSTTLPKLTKRNLPHLEQPTDLLHGLQLFLLGPGKSSAGSAENEREDELEDGDLEAGIKLKSKSEATGRSNEVKKKEDNGNKDDKSKELCASSLKNKGIYIWKTKRGSRGIRFMNLIACGSLFLPTLKVNHDTIVLYTNLKYYEIAQQQKEVRSYLNFLAQLISTYEDVNVLTSQGIIDDSSTTSDEKERFLEMLRSLADKETMTHRHHSVIGRVKDYSVFPWERFKYVAIIVFILTIAQTLFSVLSYDAAVKQLHQSPS